MSNTTVRTPRDKFEEALLIEIIWKEIEHWKEDPWSNMHNGWQLEGVSYNSIRHAGDGVFSAKLFVNHESDRFLGVDERELEIKFNVMEWYLTSEEKEEHWSIKWPNPGTPCIFVTWFMHQNEFTRGDDLSSVESLDIQALVEQKGFRLFRPTLSATSPVMQQTEENQSA